MRLPACAFERPREAAQAVCPGCQLSGRCGPERFDTGLDATLRSVRLSASTDVTATSVLLLAPCQGLGLHGGAIRWCDAPQRCTNSIHAAPEERATHRENAERGRKETPVFTRKFTG